ncbi:GerAB/ArcD/ProY family transporter, partial [Brevibacillus sp. 179-C9.3 HS]|uniref:GerAB/ArcD/ProY family transporter n=1 Tax=unclassified Brevibacillus TaxID=2684853 RepID=UPI0039A060D2
EVYADCSDVIFHDFWIGDQTRAALIYIDGLTNTEEVDQHVLAPLQQSFHHEPTLLNMRKKIAVSSIKQVETIADVFTEISDGNPVLFLPVFITLFLLVIVPITTDLQLSNLFPIMGEGIRPSIEGAFVLQTWYSEMIIASIFLPFVADQNNANKNVLRSLLAIMATLVI